MPTVSEVKVDKNASVAKNLFLGSIVEENLFPFPKLSTAEEETLSIVLDSIDKCLQSQSGRFREFDQKGEQPADYLQRLRELGLFGLVIPEEYGGIGLSNSAYARVIEQITRYDGSTALTVGAHSSIGMKGLLLFGTDAQKKKYLPKLASGECIASFCLTESGAGSDAASVSTHATKNPDGSWLLNGEKIWITNGAFADFFTVFAKTDSAAGKMTAFIVERAFGGVESGPKEDKLGIRASATTTIRFDNVRVPAECVLGEEGKGFKVAMSILNNGRTGLGGGAVGAMKRCIELAAKQSSERKQFGKKINEYELVKEKLARMVVNCFATESVVRLVGHYIDSGVEDYSVEAAMSKIFASEALWQTVNDALQIAGGNGFMKEFPYEMILRDSRINLIFEGTNEILRLYIALSGMKDVGDYLKDVGKSLGGILNDPIKGFGVLSGYATKRVLEFTPLGNDTVESVHKALRPEAEILENATRELSKVTSAILRKYGKNIVGHQYIQKRLAESATDIFVGLAVLSRVTATIADSSVADCTDEIRIAQVYVETARQRIYRHLRKIEREEDEAISKIADFAVTESAYPWDTISRGK